MTLKAHNKSIFKAIQLVIFFILIGLVNNSCKNSTGKNPENIDSNKIQVGVYTGNGASAVCILETLEALRIDSGINRHRVSPIDIQMGKLDSLDVLIFPGGSGSKEYNSLGQSSEEKVKDFIEAGNGVVGICAGGYLFATTTGYPSLELIRAKTIREHYNRGRGLMGFELNYDGKEIFPELAEQDTLFVQYYDGPIYEIMEFEKFNVLGTITSDIATHQDDPNDVTPGKPAFLTTQFGKGNIFVSVGHPESTPGMRWIVPRMARWVANKELISYAHQVVRPGINTSEILYMPEIIKAEKEKYWDLFSSDENKVVSAIDHLNSIRSRPSIRWSIGLLRHNSPKVRIAAANYLLETEYTFAIPDLESAISVENDANCKTELIKTLKGLEQIIN